MVTCLHQCTLGHTARTSDCNAPGSLDEYLNRFFFLLLTARRVRTDISVSSSKKRARNNFSRLAHVLIERAGSFMNHSKAISLRVPMRKWAMITLFDTKFSVWDLSSIYAGSVTLYHRSCVGSDPWTWENSEQHLIRSDMAGLFLLLEGCFN